MSSVITALKLRYLKNLEELCIKKPIGLATPTDVEDKMGLKPKTAKVMLKRLHDMDLLERPYRGCYRLSEEGRNIMKEVSG